MQYRPFRARPRHTGTGTATYTAPPSGSLQASVACVLLVMALAEPARAAQTILQATKDTYLSPASPTTAYGGGNQLVMASSPSTSNSTRVLVAFSTSAMQSAVAGKTLQSAVLQLYVDPEDGESSEWDSEGDLVQVRRVTQSWDEATASWNCRIVTGSPPLSSCSTWSGGTFGPQISTSLHTNGMTGWAAGFDVTQSVLNILSGQAQNNGWAVRKVDETTEGQVNYSVRETGSSVAPRLILWIGGPDTVDPTITPNLDPAPNGEGWNNTGVTVSFVCDDQQSGIVSCPGPALLTTEGTVFIEHQTAVDNAGNDAETSVTVQIDLTPPSVEIAVPEEDTIISSSPVSVSGTVSDALSGVDHVTCNGVAATVAGGGFTCSVPISSEVSAIEVQAFDVAGNQSVDSVNVRHFEPTEPDNTVATDICAATEFIYTGVDPVQTDVSPGTIECKTVGVVRGNAFDAEGDPLPRVTMSVLDHPELGSTETRSDGSFDIAVNGGRTITLRYTKESFLPVYRRVNAPWRDYATVDDAILIPAAPAGTVDLTSPDFVVAQAPPVQDGNDVRQATLLFQPETTATLKFANGSTQAVDDPIHLTSADYTVGPAGPDRMPAGLPPTSAYTYALSFDANEVQAEGARSIEFSQPVFFYMQDALGIPAGTHVPVGVLDPNTAAWAPSPDGLALEIVSISGGLANLNVDDQAGADDTTSLGILEDERHELAELYEEGQQLWRVPITHFSAYDTNFGEVPIPPAPPPPTPAPPPRDPRTCPNRARGSSIEVENQAVSKSLSITGTPFSLVYHSGRVPGHTISDSILIPLHTGSVSPNLQRIDLEIRIAGRLITQSFSIPAPETYQFVWDHLDAYGRRLQGQHPIQVRLGYVYPAVYALPPSLARSFGLPSGVPIPGDIPAREPAILWSEWNGFIGNWDASAEGLGGWSLSVHHAYDAAGRALHLGTGGTRSTVGQPQTIVTVAGGGTSLGCASNGILATEACLSEPRGVTMGPDGSIYIADASQHVLRRVDPSGEISTVAGTGSLGSTGDGGQAILAKLSDVEAVAFGPDGSIYIADRGNFKIRRITPDGIIRTVAGTMTSGFGGDGGSAIDPNTHLSTPLDVAVAPDGTFFIADAFNNRIRRVSPDGFITTYAGGGSTSGEGIPATSAVLNSPNGIVLAPDGTLYIADTNHDLVRRVGVDGIISTVAGGGSLPPGEIGDGGPAVEAKLDRPRRLALGKDGSLYISDDNNLRIRQVLPDGTITTAAGNGASCISTDAPWGDGGPPTQASFCHPRGLALGQDGALYVADLLSPSSAVHERIRRIDPSLPGYSGGTTLLPAADMSEIYEFDAVGRHTRTLHPLTGAPLYEFSYNAAGQLVTVSDLKAPNPDFQDTTIERDPNDGGRPTAIIGPFGQRTELVVEDGWLTEVINPAGEGYEIAYKELGETNTGLIERFTDPKGNDYFYDYDDDTGLLEEELDPADGSLHLTRETTPGAFAVTVVTAMGRVVDYIVKFLGAGDELWTTTFDIEPEDPNVPDLEVTTDITADGTQVVTYPDGSTRTISLKPDPRFRMLAPTTAVKLITGGHMLNVSRQRLATLSDATDPFSFPLYTTTTTVNTKDWTSVFDPNSLELVETSPVGRQQRTTLDEFGRVLELEVPGLTPLTLTYDVDHGAVKTITQGSRSLVLSYDENGRLETVSDPNSQIILFGYDDADRVTSQTLEDGAEVDLTYDDNGNLETVTPPSDAKSPPVHELGYTPINLLDRYIPPEVDGSGTNETVFWHNPDGQLEAVDHPGASTPTSVTLGYDNAGRLQSVTSPTRVVALQYYAADAFTDGARPGALKSITTEDPNSTVTYTYEGLLLKKESWSGTVTGSVEYGYDNHLRVSSLKVDNQTPTLLGYDHDGLLTTAGAWSLTPDPNNGLLRSTDMGNVNDSMDYTDFGELEEYVAKYNGSTALFEVDYTYDSLGRIHTKAETIGQATTVFEYVYDLRGRLSDVNEDSALVSHYEYDSNGNRVLATTDGVTVSETLHDDQDRLLIYGDLEYTYTPRGSLLSKTDTGDPNAPSTIYGYDLLGNLTDVSLPDGREIEYLVDGLNRRIGKKVDGVLVQGFIYSGNLQIVEELHGSNVSRFIPGGMVKDGVTYRILRDHLGSPRIVVNASSGLVVQRLDYDEFGRVIAEWEYDPANGALLCGPTDCGPGDPLFQPFGFAGGVYDRDTGLVRFGARDYDATVGRWTTKDPIRFSGGDTNLYSYVRNDPVNHTDSTGLDPVFRGCGADLVSRIKQAITDLMNDTETQDCITHYKLCAGNRPWKTGKEYLAILPTLRIWCIPVAFRDEIDPLHRAGCGLAGMPLPDDPNSPGYVGSVETGQDIIIWTTDETRQQQLCDALPTILVHERCHLYDKKREYSCLDEGSVWKFGIKCSPGKY